MTAPVVSSDGGHPHALNVRPTQDEFNNDETGSTTVASLRPLMIKKVTGGQARPVEQVRKLSRGDLLLYIRSGKSGERFSSSSKRSIDQTLCNNNFLQGVPCCRVITDMGDDDMIVELSGEEVTAV